MLLLLQHPEQTLARLLVKLAPLDPAWHSSDLSMSE